MKTLDNLNHPPSYWEQEDTDATRCSTCDWPAVYWFDKHKMYLCQDCMINEIIDANIIEEL